MLDAAITWFDGLPLGAVVLFAFGLILVERILSNIKSVTHKTKRRILINSWQVFGVLFPAMWLVRAAENYTQILLVACMIIFFGVYKPTKLK